MNVTLGLQRERERRRGRDSLGKKDDKSTSSFFFSAFKHLEKAQISQSTPC